VLAATIVVLGATAALTAAARPTGFVGIPIPPLQFVAVPIFDMTLFAAFVALAVAKRHDTQSHKRWMLLATFNPVMLWSELLLIVSQPLRLSVMGTEGRLAFAR
jgi:uncharacterized membrane protein YozB (DUF420 family)